MSEWKNQYVRFAKIGLPADPKAKTPNWDTYNQGENNPGYSIPVTYWVEGFLVTEPEEGMSIIIDRRIRNGKQVEGVLQTSMVSAVTPVSNDSLRIETQNSVYVLSKASKEHMISGETKWNISDQN